MDNVYRSCKKYLKNYNMKKKKKSTIKYPVMIMEFSAYQKMNITWFST